MKDVILFCGILASVFVNAQRYEFDYITEVETKVLTGRLNGKAHTETMLVNSKDPGYSLSFSKSAYDGSYSAIIQDRSRGIAHYFSAEIEESPDLKINLTYSDSHLFSTKRDTRIRRAEVEQLGTLHFDYQFFYTKKGKKPDIHVIFELEKAERELMFFFPKELRFSDKMVIFSRVKSNLPKDENFLIRKFTAHFPHSSSVQSILKSYSAVDLKVSVNKPVVK